MTEVLELRQYTLHPGRREELIELFDREFVESQEELGISLYGQFRDLDDEERFVWLRGFADLPARAEALAAFYGGPVWAAHRDAANATMADSDDVLLLRPAAPDSGFDLAAGTRPPAGAEPPGSLVTVTLYHLPPGNGSADGFAEFFLDDVRPLLAETGAEPLACLRTEPAENNFPALPVRTGENVFAWVAAFADQDAHLEHVRLLGRSTRWTHDLLPLLTKHLARPPEQLHLNPTGRSLVR
ncbi:NIPSNAP family protein [Actinophytocola gossypii]|uniref:NIPSNAP family protein n=1 Tax=Actinophytocola gossypii TaxID=2812003 RepID=A0ABT2JIC4_9PSEU|nr:NIPSNAP family protein [Actinophytocola gossypii]MCT2587471.1 NIPSNAP family protein [Actinophytocola gossypii]